MSKKPKDFRKTVLFLAKVFGKRRYAFRGTTSLVLQGLDMNVDDIDVLTDKKTALDSNNLLKEYLIEEVVFKESDKHKSYFGKFNVNGIQVEVMGNWQVKSPKGIWSQIFNADDDQRIEVVLKDGKVWLTTIETELKMFVAMGRWNAYHKIKRQISPQRNQTTLF